jgi:hypothetical protein
LQTWLVISPSPFNKPHSPPQVRVLLIVFRLLQHPWTKEVLSFFSVPDTTKEYFYMLLSIYFYLNILLRYSTFNQSSLYMYKQQHTTPQVKTDQLVTCQSKETDYFETPLLLSVQWHMWLTAVQKSNYNSHIEGLKHNHITNSILNWKARINSAEKRDILQYRKWFQRVIPIWYSKPEVATSQYKLFQFDQGDQLGTAYFSHVIQNSI